MPRELTTDDLDRIDDDTLVEFLNTTRQRLSGSVTAETITELRQHLARITPSNDDQNDDQNDDATDDQGNPRTRRT